MWTTHCRWSVLCVLALLLGARAEDAAVIADVRCVIVAREMGKSPDVTQQTPGMIAAM